MSAVLFPAPAGQGWVRRGAYRKWHLVRAAGGEYRCRHAGSPPPQCAEETLASGFAGEGTTPQRFRDRLCRYCLVLAGFDPDTGDRLRFKGAQHV